MERVLVRNAQGQGVNAIARAEGIDPAVVRQTIKNTSAEWVELREKIRERISQTCYEKVELSLAEITKGKAQKATNVSNATTAGILLDKANLLGGFATSRVEDIHMDIAAMMQPELLRQLIELKGGITALKPEHRALAERLGLA